ncbi:NADP-dependent oxidoreductase [Phocicoccus pinnipedialis]|uniref:Zinc-type alcohol dehydrogenase-like protein n=1 Tax=Phocicoccus pinnipedialis TaxID=110845 RepID=A0A6V7R8J1_9BACL|nr:NADP-dependent oxidoreductase [Jeotgalicoccus pinnipedialis]MBP1940152.1 NADPH:quinone reductase-like Zn-dependent oxidoreductase [Jeotgalicoccus pinnipedialis]CAD2073759.1 Zinc-type alcohol dehydrogenase-like protein [Jeotgalicoccus pinnipedialis]
MKAIVIEQYGDVDQLIEKEFPEPVIKENQVLIEMHATSINPIDWKIRAGYMKDYMPVEFPLILGWDAAGVVVEVGTKVTNFKVGDEVFARPATENGTYAEYVAVDENLVALKPTNISFEEAASVPLAGLTAWQCLVDFGSVKEGDTVLIHAGSGGVGSLGIQIAKSLGAHVLSTASGKNEAFLKSLGVDTFINYETTDFTDVAKDVDLVVDTMGGEILEKSLSVVKKGGKLVSIAGQPNQEAARANGITAESLWLKPNGKQLAELGALLESGEVKTHIGHTFSLTEEGLREAHALSATHHAKGKIVIKVK